MNVQIKPAPVVKSISVKASPSRAFEVFTAEMNTWWRRDHSVGKSPLKSVVVEPRTGGRWYEIGEDGAQCEWGTILAWDPPRRLVLSWQLTSEWKYDANFLTEVEVRFVPEGTGTRVELEHRNLERYGEHAEAVRKSIASDGGWQGTLVAFAKAIDANA